MVNSLNGISFIGHYDNKFYIVIFKTAIKGAIKKRKRHKTSLSHREGASNQIFGGVNIECSPICVLLRQVESVLLEVESVLLIKWEL